MREEKQPQTLFQGSVSFLLEARRRRVMVGKRLTGRARNTSAGKMASAALWLCFSRRQVRKEQKINGNTQTPTKAFV